MMRRLCFISLFLLSACQTPEQIAEAQRLQEQADFNTCRSYGLRPGGEAFGSCMFQLDLAREQQRYYYYERPRYHFGYHHFMRR